MGSTLCRSAAGVSPQSFSRARSRYPSRRAGADAENLLTLVVTVSLLGCGNVENEGRQVQRRAAHQARRRPLPIVVLFAGRGKMKGWLRRTLGVGFLLVQGCVPYRQLYRPPVQGRVVDQSGRSVSGATVEACTFDGWQAETGCPRSAMTRSDAQGVFQFQERWEWDWCCLGEAPRPWTRLRAWTPTGRTGTATVTHAAEIRIELSAAECY